MAKIEEPWYNKRPEFFLYSDPKEASIPKTKDGRTAVDMNRKERLKILARPKPNLSENANSDIIRWGTQEQIWKPKTNVNEKLSWRIAGLAVPKASVPPATRADLYEYSIGRSSPLVAASQTEQSEPSERIIALAQPKRVLEQPDEVYKPSKSKGPNKFESETAERLSQPKQLHPEYEVPREPETKISPAALKATVSDRVETLATPKAVPPSMTRDSQWEITANVLNYTPSARINELAKAKTLPDDYMPPRDSFEISGVAKKATATKRIEELCVPVQRPSMDHLQFNPNAFKVSDAAKKAKCTPRLEELSQPIRR